MAKVWHLHPALSAPMPLQMALDRLIFEKHRIENSPPIFRVFYSSEPWASVGYAAEKKSGYALSASLHDLEGLPVCRRITGGGTVIHGGDLIFALFARREDDPVKFESVETSYKHLHEAVKIALASLGCQSDYHKGSVNTGRDCFLFPIETDLLINGKKIAGGAQKRSEGVFLHEESIQPPKEIRLEDLERALLKSTAEYFGIQFERVSVDPALFAAAEKESEACIVTTQ